MSTLKFTQCILKVTGRVGKKRLAKEKYDFVNVANAFGDDKFREYYNIRTTPQIFVLDKDKKIRFKKIGAHDIANTIQFLLEEARCRRA